MANDATFTMTFKVREDGSLVAVERNINRAGKATRDLGAAQREAAKGSNEHNYSLNQGVAGSSSAAKSFSKLSQQIGDGPNGLVGAYATLAANAFAVSAAFNALKGAAQSVQILKGLEEQGARTGVTLTITAKSIKDITGDALSMADAMGSVAQMSAAGFSSTAMEKLAKVATDAAAALGRSVPDAMDRLVKGTTKLEPELLDELGIMTKLDEATRLYATQVGKAPGALTNLEKRQAFLNAALAEGERKFGGISDTMGDLKAYDSLGAAFNDLSKTFLGMINNFIMPGIQLLADNSGLLTGVLILFASSIRNQLLPGLANMAKYSYDSATALKEKAEAQKQELDANMASIQSNKLAAVEQAKNFAIVKKSPKIFQDYIDKLHSGTAGLDDHNRGIKSLDDSLRVHERLLAAGISDVKKKTEKEQLIVALKAQKAAVEQLIVAEKEASLVSISHSADVLKAQSMIDKQTKAAATQSALADAITLAGQGNVKEGFSSLRESVASYAGEQQKLSAKQGLTNMFNSVRDSVSGVIPAVGNMLTGFRSVAASSGIFNALKVSLFATAAGARVAGAALLNMIPIIGQIIMVAQLLWEALKWLWEWSRPEGTEALNKALEDQTEIMKGVSDAAANMKRMGMDSAASQTDSFNILSNKIIEVANNFKKIQEARANLGKDSATPEEVLGTKLEDKSPLSATVKASAEFKAAAGIYGLQFKALQDDLQKLTTGTNEWIKASDDTKIKMLGDAVVTLGDKYKNLGDANTQIQESFKSLDKSVEEFSRGAVISTPYDSMTRDVGLAVDAVYGLEAEMAKGTMTAEEFGVSLSGISTRAAGILSADVQSKIRDYKDLQTQIAAAKAAEAADPSSVNQAKVTALVNKELASRSTLGTTIAAGLRTSEEQLRNLQQQNRTLDASLKLEQARFNAVSKYLGETKESARAQDEANERQINAEVTKNSNQIAFLKGLQLEQKNAIDKLNTDIKGLEAQKIAIQNKMIQIKLEKEHSNIIKDMWKSLGEAISGAMDGIKDWWKELTTEVEDTPTVSLLEQESLDQIAKLNSDIVTMQGSVHAATNEMNKLGDSIDVLSIQNAAALAGIMTEAQKAARDLGLDMKIVNEYLDVYSKQAGMAAEMERLRLSTNNNIINSYDRQIKQQVVQLQNERIALQIKKQQERNTINAAIQVKRAGLASASTTTQQNAIQAEISLLQTRAAYLDTQYANEDKILRARVAAQLIEKANVDIYKEGLEVQQKGLEVIQKRLSLESEAMAQKRELNSLRAEERAANRGTTVGETAQKAAEVQAAEDAYQIAAQGLDLKIEGIRLEYGLLDAQRVALKEELKSRAQIIRASGNMTEAQEIAVKQIESSISNIDTNTYQALADQAIDNARREVTVLKQRADTLQAQLRGRGRDGGQVGAIGQAADDARAAILAMRRKKDREKIEASAVQESAVADPQYAADIQRKSTDGLISAIDMNFPTIVNSMTLLNDTLKTLVSSSALDLSGISLSTKKGAGTANTETMDFARVLQQGLPGFGQVTAFNDAFHRNKVGKDGTKGGGFHPKNMAFDFTVEGGAKNSAAADKQIKALATQFGYEVRTRNEYLNPSEGSTGGHIHVTVVKALEAAAPTIGEAIGSALTTAAPTTAPTTAATTAAGVPVVTAGASVPGGTKPVDPAKLTPGAGITVNGVSDKPPQIENMAEFLTAAREQMEPFIAQLKTLGPEGELAASVGQGMLQIGDSVLAFSDSIKEGGISLKNVAALASSVLTTITNITSAASNAKIAGIDKEIAAEQKRDGKSAESISKIEAMEKKKDNIARKQFNLNKKMSMAQAVIATATGIAEALKYGPIAGPILATLIGAMGAAQLAIISGTQYESAITPKATAMPSTLSIGKRSDAVDLAKGPNANAGGEVGYLRGSSGTGSNASNYRTIGSAYGGELMRGYGNRGFVVGEKGPEVITPETPISVTPANDVGGGQSINANFSINAIDSQGIQDVLVSQKGNIIKMLREAANASGKTFMEDVNVNVYTRPSVGKL